MAFKFTFSTKEEDVRDYTGGGNYINKSGMYDVVVKSVIVDSTAEGSDFINLWIEYEGKEQPIFQAMRLTNKDGSKNFGADLFNKFGIICGASEGQSPSDPVSRMIPMGKGGEDKECMVLPDFDDTAITFRLQMEYGMYDGKMQERKVIRNFFRLEDKATASEIVANAEDKGKQYAMELEGADKVNYRDGLTEEDVEKWKKERRSGKTEPNKPSAGFGQKRTFGKPKP